MKIYTAGIIGAGHIGGGYDILGQKEILTHAHGYVANPRFSLKGFYDIHYETAKKMAQKWQVDAFETMDDFMNGVEVVSICTNEESHSTVFERVCQYPIKGMILEKPVAMDMASARQMQRLSAEKKIPVWVNYPRPFNLIFQSVKASIYAGDYGRFITANFVYGKGLIHNGTHMMNLISYLLDAPITAAHSISQIEDYTHHDFSCQFYFEIQGRIGFAQVIPASEYTIGEMDLYFSKAHIHIKDAGFEIEIRKRQESPSFPGHYTLSKAQAFHTGYHQYMKDVFQDVIEGLDKNKVPLIGLEEGIQALEVCRMVRDEK